jgi:predicted dehydrogenase
MTYRAALIGCGKIGSEYADDPLLQNDVFSHAGAYARCPRTRLIAVCDADPDRARRCAARWGVASQYGTVEALLDKEHPDLVSICTPDATHFEVARAVLDHPGRVKAVLCEKPVAVSLDEARDLLALARRRGVVLAVNYFRRHAVNLRALRDLRAAGRLGDVQAVTGLYTKGTLHNGSHWFDLLRFLVGEPDWVAATNPLGEPGPDPTLDVTLGIPGGSVATLRACASSHFTVFEMDIIGTKGRALILDSGHQIALFDASASPRYTGYRELRPVDHTLGHRRDVLLHAVEDLVEAVDTGNPPACTGQDGLIALQIALGALASARTGARRPLSDGTAAHD